jgi:type VI secretion system protein ImpH
MASTGGTESLDVARSPLGERLRREPWVFNFFQAVRLLARLQPGRAAVGMFAPPQDEIVHIGAHPSLTFPASQIQALAWEQGSVPRMTVNFMGLIGPLGVLPNYYTELVAERVRVRDAAARDFFDIFHHRIISLFYQAWESHHFTAGYERHRQDRLSPILLDLIGIGSPGLQHRWSVSDHTLIFYGGLLALEPRSTLALESLLADYFDVEVEIEQFIGAWRSLDAQDQCCLEQGDEESRSLGWGAVAGDEIWDQQSRVRIRLGPLGAARYLDFLPNGAAYQPLRALTRAFCGNDIEFEVQLILKREEVPACELGREAPAAPQLGWFTWIRSQTPFGRDPGDTVFLLN